MDKQGEELTELFKHFNIKGLEVMPLEKNALAEEVEKGIHALNERTLRNKRELVQDIVDAVLYSSPLTKSVESLFFFINLTLFIIGAGDIVEEKPQDIEKWNESLRLKKCPGNSGLEKMFKNLIDKGRALYGEKGLNKLIDHYRTHFIMPSHQKESINQGEKNISESEYLKMRCEDALFRVCYIFIELESGLFNSDIIDQIENDNNWIKMHDHLTLNMRLVNDLYSFKKELRNGQYKCNYVFVKMINNNLSVNETVDQIVAEIKEHKRIALDHAQKFKALNKECLSFYVDGIMAHSEGNLYWSTICKRYNEF